MPGDRALPEPRGDPLGAGRARQHGPGAALQLNLFPKLDRQVEVISRPPSSSPSVGQHSRHVEELKGIMSDAFAEVSGKAEEN